MSLSQVTFAACWIWAELFRLLQRSWSIVKPFYQIMSILLLIAAVNVKFAFNEVIWTTRSSAVTEHCKVLVPITALAGRCFDTQLGLESFQACQTHLQLLPHSFFILGPGLFLFTDFTSRKGDEAERTHVIFSDNCIKKGIRKPFNHENRVTV